MDRRMYWGGQKVLFHFFGTLMSETGYVEPFISKSPHKVYLTHLNATTKSSFLMYALGLLSGP